MDTQTKSNKPRLCVEEKNGVGSTVRDATTDEVVDASHVRGQLEWLRQEEERIHKRINELERACKHTVIHDTEGWPYDIRMCYACSATTGMI